MSDTLTQTVKKYELATIQSPSKAKVDVVFIHGVLHDKPCWTSDNNVFWPQALLAPKLSNARILCFTYYEPALSHLQGQIHDSHVKVIQGRLISKLAAQRKEESRTRPIIFVAHCIGGMILENSIMDMCGDADGKEIVSCIRGILLLGTPHFKEGSESSAKEYFEHVLRLEDAKLPPKFSEQISKTQKFLAFQKKQEGNIKIKTFCANEEPPANELVQLSLSEGPIPQALDRTHLGLSQFEDSEDDDFDDVLQTLTSWLEKIEKASEEQNGQEHGGSKTHFQGANSGMQIGTNRAALSGTSFTTTYGGAPS